MTIRSDKGFTLIESIIAIVIIGIAMVSLTSFLFPLARDSARPHNEVRAAALAQSLMTEILSRGFDENSDPDGGVERCGESEALLCSTALGSDGESNPGAYNDVDDYIGCWVTTTGSEASCDSTLPEAGKLSDIFGNEIDESYKNFTANVNVVYDSLDSAGMHKRIDIVITAGNYGDYSFSAYRGNY
ncbi:MSHA biogenesis protein MshD [Vibrio albus]|uniref:MSHA biogenesis protein MshD n=1 Tax=Vibrio albus TaxID=2200953 RepID=A0A2U3B5D5_9VIBR|nr:prepilin-type N-terminal cleavage/methylation domain-containing protein [Vibrio albus]PWI32013.1 MSHA biogenesis protein MshD [Vibrio albus]